MTDIVIQTKKRGEEYEFEVDIEENGGKTSHQVKMSKLFREQWKHMPPETIVHRSFEFLLEKEPKESILASFDISEISKYFPEYIETISKMMGQPVPPHPTLPPRGEELKEKSPRKRGRGARSRRF